MLGRAGQEHKQLEPNAVMFCGERRQELFAIGAETLCRIVGRVVCTSCSAGRSIALPDAAASTANMPPEETSPTCADPPASAVRAPMPSISRSAADGSVSPLAPRPRLG